MGLLTAWMVDDGHDLLQTLYFAAALGVVTYLGSLWLSQVLSPRLTRAYAKLPLAERREWDARFPSTFHAVVIVAACLYLFIWHDVFGHSSAEPAFGLRASTETSAALGYSLGYFATDLVLLVLFYPSFGGVEIAAHHVAALASVATAALKGQGHAYTLCLLATECTTPFVNARWLLDKLDMRSSRLYVANGLGLAGSWFLGRIVLMLLFFAHVALNLDDVLQLSRLSIWLIAVVPPLLFTLNVWWFSKIVRGARKMLEDDGKAKDT